nr:cationic amino acid transporter 3-like [Bubalus bubalis]
MQCQDVHQFGQKLVHRWRLEPREGSERRVAQCLNTLDLVALGVGSSLGAGVYIMAGAMATYTAGPAIIICFLMATLSSLLSGLCYVELVARALQGTFSPYMPSFLATFPDFVTLSVVLVIGVLVLRAQVSALVIKAFTAMNLSVPIIIILSGFIKGDLDNWQLTEQDYKLNTSESSDIYMLGGGTSFSPAGKEALNPQRSTPLSMVISIFIRFLVYFGVSAALTLMVPYYQIQPDNPLSQDPARYIMAVVFLCALLYSLLGAMFVMSQLIYEMAEDGLLFWGLTCIHARTKTPVITIVVFGTLAGVLALLFNLLDIVEPMLIGVLLAYTLGTFSVLVLSTTPTQTSGQIVYGCAFLLVPLLTILSVILAQWPSQVFSGDPGLTTVAVLLLLLITGADRPRYGCRTCGAREPARTPLTEMLPVVAVDRGDGGGGNPEILI